MNRRAFLSKFVKIGAAVGVGGSALIAIDEIADAAGCGNRYTGYYCSHGVWYRTRERCCTTPSGGLTCWPIEPVFLKYEACWL